MQWVLGSTLLKISNATKSSSNSDEPSTLQNLKLFIFFFFSLGSEINLLWAIHQVHHSSEDYNYSTGLRLHSLQKISGFGLTLPLALLGLPLPAVAVHLSMNFVFQFSVHTELGGNLGPIGWIFNTPSHHRVHHGKCIYFTVYCLSGALLVIIKK